LPQPQPQLGSAQQHEGSAAQLASQQPQLWLSVRAWKAPQSRSQMQQPPPQQLEHESPQLLPHPQLGSAQQLCSQQHDFSQQLQLCSEQQPQPLPSMRSNKQKPKLGLVRAMLTMSAPKKFFIGHCLL